MKWKEDYKTYQSISKIKSIKFQLITAKEWISNTTNNTENEPAIYAIDKALSIADNLLTNELQKIS